MYFLNKMFIHIYGCLITELKWLRKNKESKMAEHISCKQQKEIKPSKKLKSKKAKNNKTTGNKRVEIMKGTSFFPF